MTATALSDLRRRVATALAGDSPAPPDSVVLPDAVDSLTPPAYLLRWGDPWLIPATFCYHVARLDVMVIAGRVDPAPGIETLEEMIAVAINRLRAADLPEVIAQPPGRFDVGNVPYLAARLSIEARITIPSPEYVAPIPGATYDDAFAEWDSPAFTFDGLPVV